MTEVSSIASNRRPASGGPGRVLVIEDERDVGELMRYHLAREPRTVDVHVARLRAKFTAQGLAAPGIETVRGVGYRFQEPDS